MIRAFDVKPLHGPWHLAPNPYSARYIPGTNRLYERARLNCLPGDAGHGGEDIDADSDDKVLRAVWDGIIHRYAWDDFGNHIGLVNSDGIEAFYAHLAIVHVNDGQAVKADADLGIMGQTGNATGVHTHFELRTQPFQWCSAVDPTNWLLAQPQPQEEDMYLFKKQSVSTVYMFIGNGRALVTPHQLQVMGVDPKTIHALPDTHDFFSLPFKDWTKD